jgi:hypothetical protein
LSDAVSRRSPFLLAILLATLASYSGAAVVGGPGLHRLAGCEHSASHDGDHGDDDAPRLVGLPTDCVLCHVVGQAAIIAAPSPSVGARVPRFQDGPAPAIHASAAFHSPARPRAPPLS